jgi:methionyl aminopeptidase
MPRDSNGHLTPGRISPLRSVPREIERPEYVGKKAPKNHSGGDVYPAASIDLIRESSLIAAQAIQAVGRAVRPGITTDELDRIGHDFVVAADGLDSLRSDEAGFADQIDGCRGVDVSA